MSGQYEEYMERQQEKQEDLLNLPEYLGEAHETIRELFDIIKHERRWQSKVKDWFISGIIGTAIGFGLSFIL